MINKNNSKQPFTKWLWFFSLSCSVIGLGEHLYTTQAPDITWLYLFGCVVFGYFLKDSKIINV